MQVEEGEIFLGRFLRTGVLVSAVLIGFGLVSGWVFPRTAGPGPEELKALTSGQELVFGHAPTTLRQIAEGVADFDPTAIVALGLVALIALPMLRVALTAGIFAIQRDWVYFGVTVTVLVILASGVLLGKGL